MTMEMGRVLPAAFTAVLLTGAVTLIGSVTIARHKQYPVPHAHIESYKAGVIRAHILGIEGNPFPSFTAICESKIVDALQTGVREPKECRLAEGFVGQTIKGSEPRVSNQDGALRFASTIPGFKTVEPGLFVLMQEKDGRWQVEFFRQCGIADLGPLQSYCD